MHHEMQHFPDHNGRMKKIANEGRLTFLALGEHTRRTAQQDAANGHDHDQRRREKAFLYIHSLHLIGPL